jgi:hypothetical protein
VPGSTVTTSSSVGGAPTTVPASASAPAQQFLSAADDVDSAYTQWKTAADAATAADQLAGPASSYVTALTSFDDTLRSLAVTGRTATDVHSLMGDDAVVIGDLDTAGAQTASSQAAWVARLRADGATAVVASNAVRSDLGLPAAPTD